MAGTHHLPSQLASLPTSLVAETAEIARDCVHRSLAAVDAREHHYLVLAALREVDALTPSELARATGLDGGDVAATVNILTRAGHVTRTADDAARRRTRITLTDTGRQRLDQLDRLLFRAQAALLVGLTNRERLQLIRLLTSVLDRHRTELDHR
ncbi:MAG: MarR family transcriptional regulator [Streptosporangiales bacterium]|nr:MarR family transcriptional regulator [Streptosporangiales bacterium]